MRTTLQERERLRGLLSQATARPWVAEDATVFGLDDVGVADSTTANAALIVAAVNCWGFRPKMPIEQAADIVGAWLRKQTPPADGEGRA